MITSGNHFYGTSKKEKKNHLFCIVFFLVKSHQWNYKLWMNEVGDFLYLLHTFFSPYNSLFISPSPSLSFSHTHTLTSLSLSLSSLSFKEMYNKLAVAVKWCVGSPESSFRANSTKAREISFSHSFLLKYFLLCSI